MYTVNYIKIGNEKFRASEAKEARAGLCKNQRATQADNPMKPAVSRLSAYNSDVNNTTTTKAMSPDLTIKYNVDIQGTY